MSWSDECGMRMPGLLMLGFSTSSESPDDLGPLPFMEIRSATVTPTSVSASLAKIVSRSTITRR